jgi:alpha-galactosidase
VQEYDIDGLKLDFIDQFAMQEDDQIKPGMDYLCVQEAVEHLLQDVSHRLYALKPDIMIEFRQSYIGPVMRRFGNMFRVGDCAMDITKNRVNLVDLRLMMGGSACHSDMLCWGNDESAEDAALQILNSMFGVIQFSQMIREMSAIHKEMTSFWLDFSIRNRRILLKSQFIPLEPNYLYPVIQAQDEREAIIGVYALNKIIAINAALERIQIINATKANHVYLQFSESAQISLSSYNVLGKMMPSEARRVDAGIYEISVPRSGLMDIRIIKTNEEVLS